MQLTANEKNEWKRYAGACRTKGYKVRADLIESAVDNSPLHISLITFDDIATLYRRWLCFNQF